MGSFDRLRDLAAAGADLDDQRAALAEGFRAHGVSEAGRAAILEHVRDGVNLVDGAPGATTRIGGEAELPPGESWPLDPDGRPFTFVARIAFADLPPLAPLPADGTLLIFWNLQYFERDRMDFRAATRVFHVPAGSDPVAVGAPPAGAGTPAAVPLRGVVAPILGNWEEVDVPTDDEEPAYLAQEDLNHALGFGHQLLGTSRDIQGPVLGEIAYWFREGYPESRAGYSDAEQAGEGWVLLAQLGSTDDLMFGDAGALYVVIPAADLDARRFDRAIGIMQCT
jgi:hypothetical protein